MEEAPAPPIILRPYQEAALQAFMAARDRQVKRSLIVCPTGTGKTSLFSAIITALAKEDPGFAALVLAHRRELIEQAQGRIARQNPNLRVEMHRGEEKAQPGADVVVGSVQALGRVFCEALDWLAPTLTVVDEAHHAAADTYQRVFARMGCYEEEGGSYLLGVTATPHRLDNKALHGHHKAIFEEIIYQYELQNAIRDGWLVDLKGYRVASGVDLTGVKSTGGDYKLDQLEEKVNTEPRNELAFKSWKEAADGHRTIVFCAGVDHAERMAEIFRDNGVTAECVHGALKQSVREAIMERFRDGRTQVLTNMDIATEGFDVPACSCVVLLRPTKSWALYSQMVGRGLRVLPGLVDGVDEADARRAAVLRSDKPHCVVIDVVDVAGEHQLGKAPKHGEIPCLNGMVGLPDDLDLEDHTLAEAAELFEELPEDLQSAAFRRPTKFSGLTAKLTAIDILGELSEPDEAIAAGATMTWQKLFDFHYLIGCGYAGSESQREAHMQGDILGNWWLQMVSSHRNERVELPSGVHPPFLIAEAILRENFPGMKRWGDKLAPWRQGAPSGQQIAALRHFGVEEEVIERVSSRGQASALISRLTANLKREGA